MSHNQRDICTSSSTDIRNACTWHSEVVHQEAVSELLQHHAAVKTQQFSYSLEELPSYCLEIVSCLLLAWMSLLYDLAGWSLFLVLQDHDGIDYGTSLPYSQHHSRLCFSTLHMCTISKSFMYNSDCTITTGISMTESSYSTMADQNWASLQSCT